jgi:hypothetical protein
MSLKKFKIMAAISVILLGLLTSPSKVRAQDDSESRDDESYIPPAVPSSPSEPNQPVMIQDDSEGANGESSYEN